MRTQGLKWMLSLFFLACGMMVANAQQERAEVPGDNFSLEGALELFKKSSSPEEFEKMLNSPDSKVNNLDLNGDGYVDYIRVVNRKEGNVHIFILQSVIAEGEFQDIAVISLEKLANGKAVLQITGDEDIYGIETIIEPTEEVYINAGTTQTTAIVNVWSWPAVQYIYSPSYTIWVSPWTWVYRPVWWHTWRPVAYYVYDPWWHPYRPYYSVCYTHRIVYRRHIYHPYRTTSVIVYNRYNDRIRHYRSTHDRQSHYSRNGRDRYDGDRRRYSDHDGNSGGRQRPSYKGNENYRSPRTNWTQQRGDNDNGVRTRDSYTPTRGSNDSREVKRLPERNANSQREFNPTERKSTTPTYTTPQRKSETTTPGYSSPQRRDTENPRPSYSTPQRQSTETTRPSYSSPQRQNTETTRPSYSNPQRQNTETTRPSYSSPQRQNTETTRPSYSSPQRQSTENTNRSYTAPPREYTPSRSNNSSGSSTPSRQYSAPERSSGSSGNVTRPSAPSNNRSSESPGIQRSGSSSGSNSSGRRGRD